MIDALLPAGLVRFRDWHRTFRALGLSRSEAARAAASRPRKRAYAQSKLQHLPPSVRSSLRCVVDVGANEGQWSTALVAFVQPTRLELFEPNPACVERLRSRFSGIPGARVHAMGLGDRPGELALNLTRSSDFASFLQPRDQIRSQYAPGATEITSRVTVPVDTLDRVLHDIDAVDLLKLDVQGFERHVIAGGRETLRRTRAVLVEANFLSHYAGDESFASLMSLLHEVGMTLWDVAPPFRAEDGRVLWCDAVFLPSV